jgi:hypothetical protein
MYVTDAWRYAYMARSINVTLRGAPLGTRVWDRRQTAHYLVLAGKSRRAAMNA